MLLSKVNYVNTPSTVVPAVTNSNFLVNDDYRTTAAATNGYLMHHHHHNNVGNTTTTATSNALSAYTAVAAAAALSASTQHHVPHHHNHHHLNNSSTHSIEVILGAQRILQSEFEKTFQNSGGNSVAESYNNNKRFATVDDVLVKNSKLNSSYDAGMSLLRHL